MATRRFTASALFGALAALLLPWASATSAIVFRPTSYVIPTEREIIRDGSPALVFDEVIIPLQGPDLDLVDDGSRQTFTVDLAPLKVHLMPDARYYDISLFIPDARFPLSGSIADPGFWPADPLDRVTLQGANLSPSGLPVHLQEYRVYVAPAQRTAKLAFFAAWHTPDVIPDPDSFAQLSQLEYALDFPTAMLNSPALNWRQAALRITVQRHAPNNDQTSSLPLAVFTTVAGDFNADGSIDAADYIVWRKTNGTPAKYDEWRTHFGAALAGGAASAGSDSLSNIPEPASLLIAAAALLFRSRRHSRRRLTSGTRAAHVIE